MTKSQVERNQEIIRAVQSGEILAKIGERYGVTRQRISQISMKAGICRGWHRTVTVPEKWTEVLAQYHAGVPAHSIDVGCSPKSVYQALVREGIHKQGVPSAQRSSADKDFVRKHYHSRSVAEIAAHLGTTRNAVVGLAHRMGLCRSREASHGVV